MDLSRSENCPYMNVIGHEETLDSWFEIRRSVKDLSSHSELLAVQITVGFVLFVDLIVVVSSLLSLFLGGSTTDNVETGDRIFGHFETLGTILFVVMSLYVYLIIDRGANANMLYQHNANEMSKIKYQQSYLIRR